MQTRPKIQSLTRLLAYLLANPSKIGVYYRYGLTGAKGFEGWSWITEDAFNYLKEFLQPGMMVFQYGSGYSTLFLSRQQIQLYTVENSARRLADVQEKLMESTRRLLKLDLYLKTYSTDSMTSFRDSGFATSIQEAKVKFDVILVGNEEVEQEHTRIACFQQAEEAIKPGGLIILNDFWRYEALRETHKAQELLVFEGVGYGRKRLTSTAVFRY